MNIKELVARIKRFFGIQTRATPELGAIHAWLSAFTNVLQEQVPGEKFTLTFDEDTMSFVLDTESKRVMVAWSEMQEAIKNDLNPQEINDLVEPYKSMT